MKPIFVVSVGRNNNLKAMNIIQIYEQFPTKQDCYDHLEQVRWGNNPECPYCQCVNCSTPMPKENRHHCNTCNMSYSVTVGTIFHNTKLDFQKWFVALSLILNAKKGLSARQLARDISVTKDTAWLMQMRIREAMTEYGDMLEGIVEVDETYIGGKNKNRHMDKKKPHTQGRSTVDKIAVVGILERGGKIRAGKVKDVSSRTLKTLITENVKPGSKIMTDEFKSYNGLEKKFVHSIVSHGIGNYVNGEAHTNTIEGFWSLLKRGIVGQYHYVTAKHIDKYITEFCFRYNNRDNENIFELTLGKALNV